MDPETETRDNASVCLIRFHDGSAKPNWGGRATSMALAGLVDRARGIRLASVVNGHVITGGLPELGVDRSLQNIAARALLRSRTGQGRRRAREIKLRETTTGFKQFEELACAVLTHSAPGPTLRHLRSSIEAADEVWMNGEGDFILGPRRTLLTTLVYMQMAIELGKPVRLINSILSPPPASDSDPVVVAAVGRLLGRCDTISYRDPASLRLHEQQYPGLLATWAPDALFTWASSGATVLATPTPELLFSPLAEGLPPDVQQLMSKDDQIVVISGSSAVRSMSEDPKAGERSLREVVTALRAEGLQPVVAATCSGDDWMYDLARREGWPATPARLPLVAGMVLMSRAVCFLSGRYHPAILASTVGTPLVLMRSNSHKTLSVQEVLGVAGPIEYPFFTHDVDVRIIVDAVASACAQASTTREMLPTRMRGLVSAATQMVAPGIHA